MPVCISNLVMTNQEAPGRSAVCQLVRNPLWYDRKQPYGMIGNRLDENRSDGSGTA